MKRRSYGPGSASRTTAPLTARQLEVLALYVQVGAKEAALRLRVSESTIHTTLHAARRRTGWSLEQMIYHGTSQGWLVVPDGTAA